MGLDVAFHAIKDTTITNEVIPFLIGEKNNIDPLIDRIVRVRLNRYIANYFGLEISQHLNMASYLVTELYNFGRPFFITEPDLEIKLSLVDQYCAAQNDEEVFALVKSQAALLDPTLYELVVQRKMGYKENEPEFKELISRYTEDANILKKLCAAAMNKTLFDFQNQQWDPLKILSNPYMLMEFLAMGYPAWMDRGPCHISMMVAETGITVPDYFMAPHALLGKLNEFIHIETSPILHENYTLGIVVFPEHMSAFAHFFEQHRNIFESYLLKNGWSQQGADCTLLKINEAIIYCLMSQSIFVESTDIFSAPLGIIT